MKRQLIYLPFLLAAAELLASLGVWRGTPTDWVGQPLHFWDFELLRLRYWFGFGLLFAILWAIGWRVLRLHWAKIPLAVLGLACPIGTEVMTSIYFWRGLTLHQILYLGLPDFREYFWDHLISWTAILIVGLSVWYFRIKRRRMRPLTTTTESPTTTTHSSSTSPQA
jgi:hypothetical protein